MDNPIISVRHLNFYYGKQHALHDINMDFQAHAITAIIGPSGSGKSTLLRVLNKIYSLYHDQRATGSVLYRGQDIINDAINLHQLRTRIGMVFQKPTPFPMSIFDNIAFPLRQHFKMSKSELADRVESALRQATLWDEVKNKLHDAGTHLSGGQQQRLCFARCIATEPEVLLLDEPASALDPISKYKISELILSLKENFTIIMVTHDIQAAKRYADFTAFMQLGQLLEFGTSEQLFTQPQSSATANYLSNKHSDA